MNSRSAEEPNTPSTRGNANTRVRRRARITALAESILEDKAAARNWLTQPQSRLGGRVPQPLLSSEAGAREVEMLLRRLDAGVYV